MIFKESQIAHSLLDGLKGIEIGGAAHNPFGLDTINVDRYSEMDTVFKREEIALCGHALPVDVVAPGNQLPFEDQSFDFVISSHVIEHFFDPIDAIMEWCRVARKYVFIICPHRDRTFDKDRPLTTINDLIERMSANEIPSDDTHWSVWNTTSFIEMLLEFNIGIHSFYDVDDKVGNGFIVVIDTEVGHTCNTLSQNLTHLIKNLRRGHEIEISKTAFRYIVEEKLQPSDYDDIDLRNLVSIVDTYADHGTGIEQANATMISAFFNMVKIADSIIQFAELTPTQRSKSNGVFYMYDGINSLRFEYDDMPSVLFHRINCQLEKTPVLKRIFDKIIEILQQCSRTMKIASEQNPLFFTPQYFPGRKNWKGLEYPDNEFVKQLDF